MSNLRLFEPRLFEPALSDSFESLFRRFMAPMQIGLENGSLDMRLDVAEVDGMYKVVADLPGVRKDDISVRIAGNQVQIEAQARKHHETQEAGGRMLRSERWQGAVARSFTLSDEVDDTKASARYEDGVLTLELPKRATSATRRLAVQ
ncbi:MAG: Hsp20/alpha crystallin family protein [Rhodoferax sp.]|nr:Hsp20/alpha crystallin family protein [Rhodoferax sp.]